MKNVFIFIVMVFLHVFSDFNLQGILALMKQKEWWQNQLPKNQNLNNTIYKNDYKISLLAHAFEWTFMVMLPLIVCVYESEFNFPQSFAYLLLYAYNVWFHYIVDNDKANEKKINLVIDQATHIGQIAFTLIMWRVVTGI